MRNWKKWLKAAAIRAVKTGALFLHAYTAVQVDGN